MSDPGLILHGHFYQPPRENPWTELIDRQPSAAPFSNWNERIYEECYRPNAYARIFDGFRRILTITNNYGHMSFNIGPTLLSWMEQAHPRTYARILQADRESVARRSGHGNAIAQAYHHPILPLCDERDRRTEIRWGIADFRHRFGRDPEALWLPETACNEAVLDALIDEGLKFAILSPYQAAQVRTPGEQQWRNVEDGDIDPGRAYRYTREDGRTLALFFYQGPLSKAIAFEGLLTSSKGLVDRLQEAVTGRSMVSVATDGETFGHHFQYGDLALAHAAETEAPRRGFRLTNYAEFLEQHPPEWDVRIKPGPKGEGTSWSCAHGVGRWIRDCGCQAGGGESWNQAWRGPLREAQNFLRDEIVRLFEQEGGKIFRDPWEARDAYIERILFPEASPKPFLQRHAKGEGEADTERALTLLEMQRQALMMFTSCGWFFADISGIETVQVLKYSGRAMDLMEELGLQSPRDRFLEILSNAKSNLGEMGSGADVFRRFVDRCRVTERQMTAHLGISSLLDEAAVEGEEGAYAYRMEDHSRESLGRLTLATGRPALRQKRTFRRSESAFCGIHLGGVDFYCMVKSFGSREEFSQAAERVWARFRSASLPSILRIMEDEFGPEEYGMEHVLDPARRRISERILADVVRRLTEQYAGVYEDHNRAIERLQATGYELPAELKAAAEFTLGRRFEEEVRAHQGSRDPAAYRKAVEIAQEVTRRGYKIDRTFANRLFGEMILQSVDAAVAEPSEKGLASVNELLRLTRELQIDPDVRRAQENLFDAIRNGLEVNPQVRELAGHLYLAPSVLERDAQPAETK